MNFKVEYTSDATEFRARVERVLIRREAENNLVFGILAGIAAGRQNFSDQPPLFAAVEDDAGAIQAVALRTPPHNIVLSTAQTEDAVTYLARALHATGCRLPGVTAPQPEAEAFAREWTKLTGARARRAVSQRIYSLERVIAPSPVKGRMRAYRPGDESLALRWLREFNDEVGELQVPADVGRFIGYRDTGLVFWIDRRPVAMAGYSGPTPNGIRIGPVYTPPAMRRRGYAGACVAALSGHLLEQGRRFCFLYTDQANATANHVYQTIGYRPVCDGVVLMFES